MGFKMKIRLSWKLFGVMMFNVVLIVGVMVVIMNLLADFAIIALDPRVRSHVSER